MQQKENFISHKKRRKEKKGAIEDIFLKQKLEIKKKIKKRKWRAKKGRSQR